MDKLEAIAQHLAYGSMQGNTASAPSGLSELPKYLHTAAGREANRAAIEASIARASHTGQKSSALYKDILTTLLGSMSGRAASVNPGDPMQSMSDPNSQAAPQGFSSGNPAPSLLQQAPMQGLSGKI